MKAGGIESVRWPLAWGGDPADRQGRLRLGRLRRSGRGRRPARAPGAALPLRHPALARPQATTLPIDNATARAAWTAFLKAAVKRYGPGGEFWKRARARRRPVRTGDPRPLPIRTWQIWNEANFFYFAYPVSPQRYAKLVQISSPAIKRGRPRRQGHPHRPLRRTDRARRPRACRPPSSSTVLYRTPGIKSRFDGIALHPYAVDAETLEELVEELHDVTVENHDRVPLYITEMGWGSQNDFNSVAFEQGVQGQVKQLQGRLRLPAREPQPPRPQAGLLVLLEGPAGLLQLLRLGRPLPRRPDASSRSPPGAPSSP